MQEEPALFRSLLHKSHGTRSDWEYPFAVAGINLTVMLEEVIGLRDSRTAALLPDPQTSRTAAGRGFLQQLSVSECAFEEVSWLGMSLPTEVWKGPGIYILQAAVWLPVSMHGTRLKFATQNSTNLWHWRLYRCHVSSRPRP